MIFAAFFLLYVGNYSESLEFTLKESTVEFLLPLMLYRSFSNL